MVATCWSFSIDALPSWASSGCLATLLLLQGLSQRLGVGAICVGSDAFCRLVWLGGLCGGPPLFRFLCLASLLAVVFLAFFKFFSVFSLLCTWVGQPLFGLLQEMSVNCFLLNEIRAQTHSRKNALNLNNSYALNL